MANIDISQNKLEEASSYLIQYLRDAGFTGSTEVGTAIHDVLIKPSAILYTLFNDMATRTRAYSSLGEATEVRSSIGEDEYNAAVDSILQNWFVTRKEGNKSTGTIRLYFSRSLNYFRIVKDGTAKVTVDGVNYDVARDYTFSDSNFSSVYNSDRNAIEYYTDIEIETLENTAAESGDVTVNIGSIYFIRGILIDGIESGKAYETSEEFIERTRQVITTRELISNNSIFTVLEEVFTGIRELYIAGFGEPEQLRDIVFFNDVDIHVGNKADIYLNIDLEQKSTSCFINTNGVVDLTPIGQHIADIFAVRHKLKTQGYLRLRCDNTPVDTVTIPTTVIFEPVDGIQATFSTLMEITIPPWNWLPAYNPGRTGVYYDIPVTSTLFESAEYVELLESGDLFAVPIELPMVSTIEVRQPFKHMEIPFTISGADRFVIGTVGRYPICTILAYVGTISECYIDYLGNSVYSDVLNYVTDFDNRVICYDPCIKSKFIIYLHCDVTISTIGLTTAEEIEAERLSCVEAISTYINSLTKDDVFSVYDLFVAIDEHCVNIDRVKTPVYISYRFQDPESYIYYTGGILDEFSLDNVVLGEGESLSLMVTTNTFQYYINEDNINVVVDKAIY